MSIFTFIRGKLSNDLYIQVWKDRLKIVSVQTNKVYEQEPLIAIETRPNGKKIVYQIGNECKNLDKNKYQIVNPFLHPRVLLGDFQVAEKIMQHAVKEIHEARFIAPAPRVVFQPMEKTEGGLTPVEERAFRELCLSAGAREVIIYVGNELPLYSFDFNKIKQEQLTKQCRG